MTMLLGGNLLLGFCKAEPDSPAMPVLVEVAGKLGTN